MALSGRLITVGSGGVLAFASANTTGGNGATVTTPIQINQGGVAIVTDPGSNNTTLGPMQLSGGTLEGVGDVGNATYEMFMFGAAATGSADENGTANSYISLTPLGTAMNGTIPAGFQLCRAVPSVLPDPATCTYPFL